MQTHGLQTTINRFCDQAHISQEEAIPNTKTNNTIIWLMFDIKEHKILGKYYFLKGQILADIKEY